ncbi:MAG: hypothetical protein ACOY0T_19000 [Myxococcota bacterium]
MTRVVTKRPRRLRPLAIGRLVALLGLIVLVGLAAWRRPALFFLVVYSLVVIGCFATFSIKVVLFGTGSVSEQMVDLDSRKWTLSRVRTAVGGVFDLAAISLVWPTYLLVGPVLARSHSVQRDGVYWGALMSGVAGEVWEALFAAVALGGAVAVSWFVEPFGWLWAVALVAFALPCLRVTGIAISGRSVAERSKLWTRPYEGALVLVGLYLVLLSLGWSSLLSWRAGKQVSFAHALDTLKALTTAMPLRQLVTAPPRTVGGVIFTGAALLFYGSLYTTLKQRESFTRGDSDWLNVAMRQVVLGRYKQARKMVRNVRTATLESCTVDGVALAGLNQFADAERTVAIELRKDPRAEIYDLIPYVVLLSSGMKWQLPQSTLRRMYAFWVESALHPYQLAFAHVWSGPKTTVEVAAFEELLRSPRIAENKAYVAALLVAVGRKKEAKVALDEGRSDEPFEEAFRLAGSAALTAWEPTLTDDARRRELSAWCDESLPRLREHAKKCRPFGVVMLLKLVIPLARRFDEIAHPRAREMNDAVLEVRSLLDERGDDFASEWLDEAHAPKPIQSAILNALRGARSATSRLKELGGEREMNTGVLVLSDGTPCIIHDGDIPSVRNIEVGSDDYRVTLVWVDGQAGADQRMKLPTPLSDEMVARFRKFEIIGIGRITPERKMEDLHMIPVVFRDA